MTALVRSGLSVLQFLLALASGGFRGIVSFGFVPAVISLAPLLPHPAVRGSGLRSTPELTEAQVMPSALDVLVPRAAH